MFCSKTEEVLWGYEMAFVHFVQVQGTGSKFSYKDAQSEVESSAGTWVMC